MGTVMLARLRHGRQVAIKVLNPGLGLGPERLLREIEIAASLTHPNILPVHDSGTADGLLFYVMPYVEGESLRHRLKREVQLSPDEALAIVREVGDALAFAHAHGVVHRDIKPENILLEAGHAVVTDFGMARAVTAGDSRLTDPGRAVGTPAYMSPEHAAGMQELDGRSDQYSPACLLDEMIAGEPPFTGPSPQAILARHRGTARVKHGKTGQLEGAVDISTADYAAVRRSAVASGRRWGPAASSGGRSR